MADARSGGGGGSSGDGGGRQAARGEYEWRGQQMTTLGARGTQPSHRGDGGCGGGGQGLGATGNAERGQQRWTAPRVEGVRPTHRGESNGGDGDGGGGGGSDSNGGGGTNHIDVGQNQGAIKKEAEARAAAIAWMKRKTGAHCNDGGESRVGYGQVMPDKKRMSNGSRGGEADHAVDESRGVLGEPGNRQRQPIEPIRMPGHALQATKIEDTDFPKDRKKSRRGTNKDDQRRRNASKNAMRRIREKAKANTNTPTVGLP